MGLSLHRIPPHEHRCAGQPAAKTVLPALRPSAASPCAALGRLLHSARSCAHRCSQVALLRNHWDGVSPLYIGTDGSAQGRNPSNRVAASAVALLTGSYAFAVPTADRSAFAAELFAALVALLALTQLSGYEACLWIDNWSVVRTLRRLQQVGIGALPSACYILWSQASAALVRIADVGSLAIEWIPSHGKRLEWTTDLAPVHIARTVNSRADEAAAVVSEDLWLRGADARAKHREGEAATLLQLRAAASATSAFVSHAIAAGHAPVLGSLSRGMAALEPQGIADAAARIRGPDA